MTTKFYTEFSNAAMPELGLAAERYKISFQFDGTHTAVAIRAGESPLKTGYADSGDDIFSPIRTKKATIQLIATSGIDLDAFYLQSDRECRVLVERWDGSAYTELIFDGWLTAFDAREPFLCRPYTFELNAHCGLSSLKDFNFSATGLTSFNTAIKQCLSVTGLGLNYLVGVDTRISGDTGDPTTLYGFEAEAMNGKSCYDVLTHILDSFVADIEQTYGKYVIRGISEQAEGTVSLYEYNASGGAAGSSNIDYTVSSGRSQARKEVTAGEAQKEPAISYVQITYDLGALRDLLKNGSFTAQSFIGAYSYDYWDRYGGIQGTKQSPSGVKIQGRCEYWYINADGSRVPGVGGTGIVLPKYLGFDPMFLDEKYYESNAVTISSAQKAVIKGRFQPKYVDYARLEVFIYDSANPTTTKLWLTKDGEWKETRDFVLLDYTKQVVRIYGDDPAPLVWYPFEITSQDIPTKRTASTSTSSGNKPYTSVRYNALKVRVFRGVFNNSIPVYTSAGDSFCIYDALAVNFQSKNSENLALNYGFKNALYVRKNPIKLSIPFGGYSVAVTGGAGRIRDASLNNYASVIRRMSGGDIVDQWTKAGQGVLSDFIRLNGISRLRLGHKFGYSWEGDIVGAYADSAQHFQFTAQIGVKYKPTAYEYDFKSRTASVTLKQLLKGSFAYVETMDEGEASASGAVANTITNGSGNAKLTDPDAFTDRGLIDEPVDFDGIVLNGEYRIEAADWEDFENAPIFGGSVGRLRVFESEGYIFQYYYPESGGVHWREYSLNEEDDPMWIPEGGWNIAAEGSMLAESTEDEPEPKSIKVVDFYSRGIGSGMAIDVPTLFAFEKQNLDAFIDRTGPTDATPVTTPSNFNAFTSDGGDYLIDLSTWTGSTNAPTALAVGGRLRVRKDDGKVIQTYQQGGAVLTRTRQKKNKDNSYTWTAWVIDEDAPIETFENDFNEMVEMGAYHIATAEVPNNAPEDAATGGMLHVFITDGELMQRYYIDGEIYFRSRLGGVWGDWETGAAGVMFDTEAETPPDTVEVTTGYVDGIALAETVSVYTKDYIDNLEEEGPWVLKAGDTMTGALTVEAPITADSTITIWKGGGTLDSNMGIGQYALFANTTGANNVGVGRYVLQNNTTGADNIGFGVFALTNNTTGGGNLGIGTFALYNNQTGTSNVAIGTYTLGNTTGSWNTTIGYNGFNALTTGYGNTGLGFNVGSAVTTGVNNLFLGNNAGTGVTTGSGNVVLGNLGAARIATLNGWVLFGDGYGNERFSVSPNGNFLINQTTDNAAGKLQVNGSIWSNAQLKLSAYTSPTSFVGTVAGLLGFDSSGNVLTVAQYTDVNARNSLSGTSPIQYNPATGVISWNGTTSDVPEGSRLYYTDARARAALSAGSGISYNSVTGVISSTVSGYGDADARNAISATAPIYYNPATGVISTTLTQYTDANARVAISVTGGVLSYNPSTGVIGLASDAYDGRYSQLGHNHDDRYYTESEVNSLLSGKSDTGHNHDDRYYTEGELNTSGAGGAVHWNNVTNKPTIISTEVDPYGFDSHWFSVSGAVVTLGIQRRNGSQAYADFTVPSTGSGSNVNEVDSSLIGTNFTTYVRSDNGNLFGHTTDFASIRDADPYGVSGVGLSMDDSNTLRVIIYLRNGSNFQATVDLPIGGA